ncbi:MAG: 3-deoxy-7-phosphoheptulonate synthase class II [Bryobacteraceae bacterium]|nr:3-deoxy-7-phosphoheptulonate synthase class II [Bryobacteraceae bacterium]
MLSCDNGRLLNDWTPDSWRTRVALQQPRYEDPAALARAVAELSALPPLVTTWEVEELRRQLAEAAQGKRFLLQGGDCAESLSECRAEPVTNKLKVLLQMSLVLVHGGQRPVIRVGRFAGQYAKPRSEDTETREGVTLPSYRGDIVNRPAFTAADRRPDPDLLLRGYERAALTLNLIRALSSGGFADLHHPENWDLAFVESSPLAAEYRRIVGSIGESLRFMENVLGVRTGGMEKVDFFSSHEGLHLEYERAQTHLQNGHWYHLATHFPWIGLRTAQLDGAHVEYFRGLRNPIGVKIGASTTAEGLRRLLDLLNPTHLPGRITLIHRFGAGQIAAHLPGLIAAVRDTSHLPLWVCDPMHGNTVTTAAGYKTRRFQAILEELEQAFDLHAQTGGRLGGVHIELTGDDVTECTGGARGLAEVDLKRAYRTEVDPRLNGEQALEMALLIARKMRSLG